MTTPGLLRRLTRTTGARLSLTDARGGLALPLPSRRTWIPGLAVVLASLVVASMAWQQLVALRHLRPDAAAGVGVVLRGALVFGLWAVAVLLLLLAIGLLTHRESARLADHQLVRVTRFGPVHAIAKYELAELRNLRAVETGKAVARIRFDYPLGEQGLGGEMPRAEAETRVKLIQAAIDRVSARGASQSGSGPVQPPPRR